MNDRKLLKLLCKRIEQEWKCTRPDDGRDAVEVHNSVYFLKGKKIVSVTSKASFRRWSENKPNGVEHG